MAGQKQNQKTVLFIDDSEEFLEILKPNVELYSGADWEVLVASTTATALKTIESRHVDLAVIDRHMPVVDGLQFLQILHRKYPKLKKAILTSHADEECRSTATSRGAELVLEKPATAAEFEMVVAALTELLQWRREEGFRGVLRRVGLEDILQLECLSRHSLVLEVVAEDFTGRVFIKSGSIIHAEAGDSEGEVAFQKLFALGGGEFHHHPYAEPRHRTLDGPWEFLVMEAVRQRDEATSESGLQAERDSEASGASPSAPQMTEAIAQDEPPSTPIPCIEEMVVCSAEGELLYEWQSPAAPERCGLLGFLSEVSAKMQSALPTGPLERIEFKRPSGRMIIRLEDGQGIFVSTK